MFFFDPLFLMFALPTLLFGLWAQWRVQLAYSKCSLIGTNNRLSGAKVAQLILNAYSLCKVRVEQVLSFLSDHYDPVLLRFLLAGLQGQEG